MLTDRFEKLDFEMLQRLSKTGGLSLGSIREQKRLTDKYHKYITEVFHKIWEGLHERPYFRMFYNPPHVALGEVPPSADDAIEIATFSRKDLSNALGRLDNTKVTLAATNFCLKEIGCYDPAKGWGI